MKKSRKHGKPQPPSPAPPLAVKSSLRLWGLAALCLMAAGGTWAVLELVVWNKLPSELVGTWTVMEGPQEGATFDFSRSGKMVGHMNQSGNLAVINATVHVEGDKIYSTTRHPQTGQEATTVQTIRILNAREFVVEDQRGNRTTMRRAD